MEERRARRHGRGETRSSLPLYSSQTSNPNLSSTISCCYCDYKISSFNSRLFRFGRRHAPFLKIWFSIGVGFALASLLLVTLIVVWDLFGGNKQTNFINSLLFGFSPKVHASRLSVSDTAYLLLSTVISVSVHEFGHAISAASEGIQTEYVAVFVAFLFPGALVAFNYELLQILPHFSALRIYCAGVWHNAACCAVCGVVLFLLPLILSPFYVYGESPMVLMVPYASPLSGYLSPGDVIVSLDGQRIHNEEQWMEMVALIHEQASHRSNQSESSVGFPNLHSRKGYCIPNFLIEEGKQILLVDSQYSCPDDLSEFVAVQCFGSSKMHISTSESSHMSRTDSSRCLNAKDVVKLKKCGHGWFTEITNRSSCVCSLGESCLGPVQFPGLIWAEITYSRPYSSECLLLGRNSIPNSDIDVTEDNCGGTFIFVGDVISMAHSVHLTAYQPRWALSFAAYIPKILEKSLVYTFQVSLAVALLNSLPVYLLDGESILEAALRYFTLLGPRKKEKVLQACLLGGTIICMLAFVRIFFINVF